MKNTFAKMAVIGLLAAAVVSVPTLSRAADETASTATTQTSAKHHVIPFHGKISAVDTAAMTLTVGKRTFKVADTTKISKDGNPAKLPDAVVGNRVSGAYKKADDGTLNAISINLSPVSHHKKAKADDTN